MKTLSLRSLLLSLCVLTGATAFGAEPASDAMGLAKNVVLHRNLAYIIEKRDQNGWKILDDQDLAYLKREFNSNQLPFTIDIARVILQQPTARDARTALGKNKFSLLKAIKANPNLRDAVKDDFAENLEIPFEPAFPVFLPSDNGLELTTRKAGQGSFFQQNPEYPVTGSEEFGDIFGEFQGATKPKAEKPRVIEYVGAEEEITTPAQSPTPTTQAPVAQASAAAPLSEAELKKVYSRLSTTAGRNSVKADSALVSRIQASAGAGNATAKNILTKIGGATAAPAAQAQAQPSISTARAPEAQAPAAQASGAAVLSEAELKKIYSRLSSAAGRNSVKADSALVSRIQASAGAGNATAKNILTKLK